ncbi:sugar transferase [Microbacterium caowuchunii]|uniref:Sugar transferase n=2 Tax=Microbacterium caowuchunii TaxID=2614638 RepID=A0A5N0TN00_9MICO|nr:sugar transferase [Microbacterium caowuchunii]
MPAAGSPTLESVVTPRPTPELLRRLRNHSRHAARLTAGDAIAVGLTMVAVTAAIGASAVPLGESGRTVLPAVAAGGLVLWMSALAAVHSREPGMPPGWEYRRVARAAALVLAVAAVGLLFLPSAPVRLQALLGVPTALAVVLANRWYWRRWAPPRHRQSAPRTLLVGSRHDLDALVRTFQRDGRLGYHVVGTTLVGARAPEPAVDTDGAPVLGAVAAAAQAARELGADTVIVSGTPDDPDFIRRLSWQLEGTATDLILASTLTDVASGRMSLRTTTGLALVNVRIPTYAGRPHRVKRLMDVGAAACALVAIALVTPLIALLIRLDSPGPVFFRQRRVGRDGREFDIVKFRTMRVGAESELAGLQAVNEGAGALFKVRQDPRITRVGAVLRKYSIDELPQFWNVLRGDMSVVGPRPPLPSEVQAYDDPVFRRLYIRPGITGPWQIGGRSDLSWEQSVRLDLHYVENWSVASDIGIMLRTAGVVLRAKGAY